MMRALCILALAASPLLGGTAAAQACMGRAVPAGERAVVAHGGLARYDLGETVEGTDAGAAYWANPAGALGYGLGYARRLMTEGPADLDVVHAGALLEVPWRMPGGPQLCLTAVGYAARLRGAGAGTDYESYALPLGFGVGLPVRLGRELSAALYLSPSLLLVRSEGTVLGIPVEESYAAPHVEAGLGAGSGPLLGRLRVSITRPPEEAGVGALPDLRAGVELGIRF